MKKLSLFDKVLLGVFGLITISSVFLMATQGDAKAVYEPLTPSSQKTYDSARLTVCNAEKSLAGAKLMDIANGVKMEADLNELNRKKEMVCEGF